MLIAEKKRKYKETHRFPNRAIVIVLAAALIVTGVFSGGVTINQDGTIVQDVTKAYAAGTDFSQPLDPNTRTAKSTTTDYIAAKFEGISAGNHPFDVVTWERLRKGVLQQDGNSVVVLGSAANETTKKTLRYINEVAQAWGIEKIYFFEPFLDGDRGNADITNVTGPADYQNHATRGLWYQLTHGRSGSSGNKTNNGPELADINSNYTSGDTYLLIYNRKGSGTTVIDPDSPSGSIKGDFLIKSADIPSSASDTTKVNAIKTGVANAFGAVSSWSTATPAGSLWTAGNTDETAFDQYNFILKFFSAGAGGNLQKFVTKAEDFKIQTVTQPQLVNILNTPGKHIVFASGSWCGDSNAVIPFLADSARKYNEPVYLLDLRVDASYSGLGDKAHILRSEAPSQTPYGPLGVGFNYSGLAFLSAEILDLLAPFHAGENNDQVDYYPNGDKNAELKTIPQTRFRSPFLVRYEKGDNNLKGKVIDEWYHTAKDYEKPFKYLTAGDTTGPADQYGNATNGYPYIPIVDGTALDYELSGGYVNLLQKALGRANLDVFFGGQDPVSHTAPALNVSETDSELDSGCGDDNDAIDNLGDLNLIPNHGTKDYDVQDYDITIEYDPSKINALDSVKGKTVITAKAAKALTQISLDFRRQDIQSVKVNGNVTTAYTRENQDDIDRQKLDISANIASSDTFTVEVEYTTGVIDAFLTAGKSPQGFSKETGTSTGVTAIGEPFGATYWFPANNTPYDGAKYQITLIAPSAYYGVSSGSYVSTANNVPSTGQRTTIWKVNKDTAPYQVFATLSNNIQQLDGTNFINYAYGATAPVYNAAKITLTDGTEINAYSYVNKELLAINTKNKPVRDKVDNYFNKLPLYLQTLESIAGKYPGESAGFIFNSLTDGNGGNAQWGALETQNRPYYTNGADITGESTFVHEQAHQWFGDAVRIADWKSLWLNEGFATYVTHLYYEKVYGVSAQDKFKALYNNKGANSLLWKTAPADIKRESDLFGGPKVAYNRGALALATLRTIVGDDKFFDLLKGWVPAKQGTAVTTQDFIDYAEAGTGADLTKWVDEWLYGTVKPAAWPGEGGGNGDGTVITPTVDLGGGQSITLPELKAGEPIGNLPTPTREGYTFDGWYVSGQKIDANWIVPSTTFNLEARWKSDGLIKSTDGAVSISVAKIAAIPDKVYTGKKIEPAIKVTVGAKTLSGGTDYTIAYTANTAVGKATVTVTGKGGYKDIATATFKILPAKTKFKSAKAGKKNVTLKWTPASGITKQQLQYKVKGTSKWKTVPLNANVKSKVINNLKKGKTYQFRISAYKTVGKEKYTSAWSAVKTVKVKK